MSEVLLLLGVYALAGGIFAVPFVLFGVSSIDPAASRGTLGFKVMILPGCILFWPWLLVRWIRRTQPAEEWSQHRRKAMNGVCEPENSIKQG